MPCQLFPFHGGLRQHYQLRNLGRRGKTLFLMEANKNKNLVNAHEFYVLVQLAQRGYIAGKTDYGQIFIDLIATEPDTLNRVITQIKTRTIDGMKSSWLLDLKMKRLLRNFSMNYF